MNLVLLFDITHAGTHLRIHTHLHRAQSSKVQHITHKQYTQAYIDTNCFVLATAICITLLKIKNLPCTRGLQCLCFSKKKKKKKNTTATTIKILQHIFFFLNHLRGLKLTYRLPRIILVKNSCKCFLMIPL